MIAFCMPVTLVRYALWWGNSTAVSCCGLVIHDALGILCQGRLVAGSRGQSRPSPISGQCAVAQSRIGYAIRLQRRRTRGCQCRSAALAMQDPGGSSADTTSTRWACSCGHADSSGAGSGVAAAVAQASAPAGDGGTRNYPGECPNVGSAVPHQHRRPQRQHLRWQQLQLPMLPLLITGQLIRAFHVDRRAPSQ